MNINSIGWNDFFEAQFSQYKEQSFIPGRIAQQHKNRYLLLTEFGEFDAELSGKFLYQAESTAQYPAVGDWVVGQLFDVEGKFIIHNILPRKSSVGRKQAGLKTEQQIIAANIDVVFLIVGLDDDFNINRIERYITEIYDCGATPVVMLNKTDLCDDLEKYLSLVEISAPGVSVFSGSALEHDGMDQIYNYLKPNMTGTFIGSSGVGKSTIINRLLGYDKMKTKEVSDEKSKGRHTTTHRELILFENDRIIIDTPGMKSFGLWTDEENLDKSFDDIISSAEQCRFPDCKHESEPDCAVKDAIGNGLLTQKRYDNYQKMLREIKSLELRKSSLASHLQKVRGKKFAKRVNEAMKFKRMNGYKK